jgi:hypothetical protein
MFFSPDVTGVHTLDTRRDLHHWCPQSERYASGSHLLSALLRGWRANKLVIRRRHHFGGGRSTSIYYFELRQQDRYMTMPVLESPAVIRLLVSNPFEVAHYRHFRRAPVYTTSAQKMTTN